jgi:hypothetical protein
MKLELSFIVEELVKVSFRPGTLAAETRLSRSLLQQSHL